MEAAILGVGFRDISAVSIEWKRTWKMKWNWDCVVGYKGIRARVSPDLDSICGSPYTED